MRDGLAIPLGRRARPSPASPGLTRSQRPPTPRSRSPRRWPTAHGEPHAAHISLRLSCPSLDRQVLRKVQRDRRTPRQVGVGYLNPNLGNTNPLVGSTFHHRGQLGDGGLCVRQVSHAVSRSFLLVSAFFPDQPRPAQTRPEVTRLVT